MLVQSQTQPLKKGNGKPDKINKYMDITSSHRNRKMYPNPFNFVVSPGLSSNLASEAKDPVSDSFPETYGPLAVVTSTTVVQLASYEQQFDNYFVGRYLGLDQTGGAGALTYRLITSYVGATQVATVSPAFGILPVLGRAYNIRAQLVYIQGDVQAGSTASHIVLANTTSTEDDYYVNQWITVFTPATPPTQNVSTGDSLLTRKIIRYDGATHTAYLESQLTLGGGILGTRYEIVPFTKDNYVPLSVNFQNEVPKMYKVRLMHLSIGQQLLGMGFGGTPGRYPYFYVMFRPVRSGNVNNVVATNNSGFGQSMFKVPCDDIRSDQSQNIFINLGRSGMFIFCLINPGDSFEFKITAPNGEVLQYAQVDDMPPMYPYWALQCSATLEFIETD